MVSLLALSVNATMSGRHSFSELTKDFTQERRRRIAEMRAELLAETPWPCLHREHFGKP